MKLATPMISTRGTRCERIFCGSIRSIDCRTIQNSANARPISCASRERRIWREKSKHGDNKVTQDDFPNHIFAVPCSLGDCIIMQSIFRPASRRETLGEESEGGRRDGGLKMGWTKPLPSAWPMGIDCLPDLGRRSDVAK